MEAIIHFDAADVWALFQKEKEQLRSHMKSIAENPMLDVVIYLTEEERGDLELPNIVVYYEDNELYEEAAVNEYDCTQTVRKIYTEYLNEERLINKIIECDKTPVDDDPNDTANETEIEQREEVLDNAVYEFLLEVMVDPLEDIVGDDEAAVIYEDFKEHALEYLYRKWDLDVYRPMILEDDQGEFFEEYPYSSMVFDDPDNPVYQ